jgi:tetratricopeptide (TPR) repeat protein
MCQIVNSHQQRTTCIALHALPAPSQRWRWRGKLWHTFARSQLPVNMAFPALQYNPGHSKALYNRAVARERLRQFEAAAEDYGQVLRLDPQNAPACQNRGALWLRLGRLQEAIADLSRAVALDAGAAAAWHARGEAHERLGAIDAALADLQR